MSTKVSFEQMFATNESGKQEEIPASKKKFGLTEKQLLNQERFGILGRFRDDTDYEEVKEVYPVYIPNKNSILKVFDGCHEPDRIIFRQKQEKEIKQFISNCLADKLKVRCLLLTGMPGAGKTLLSRRLLQNTPAVTVITMNGNTISDFVEEVSLRLLGTKLALPKLLKVLAQKQRKQVKEGKEGKKKTFLLIDEFDGVFKKESAEILDIFKLFSNPVHNLSMIGTSNTMEIINSLTTKYKLTVPEVANIVFKPYSPDEIRSIIKQRIDEIRIQCDFYVEYQEVALKYAATKLSNAKGGDLRHVFAQMKNILALALEEASIANTCLLKFQHASMILIKLNKNTQGTAIIQNLPFQHCLVLVALYMIYTREQCLETTVKKLDKEITDIEETLHLEPQSERASELLKYLGVYGFMVTRERKKEVNVILKIDLEMIKAAYEDDQLLGRFFWE